MEDCEWLDRLKSTLESMDYVLSDVRISSLGAAMNAIGEVGCFRIGVRSRKARHIESPFDLYFEASFLFLRADEYGDNYNRRFTIRYPHGLVEKRSGELLIAYLRRRISSKTTTRSIGHSLASWEMFLTQLRRRYENRGSTLIPLDTLFVAHVSQ